MEREVGGGIGMGKTCKPMAVSFQCMTKSTTILKKKKRNRDKPSTQLFIFKFSAFHYLPLKIIPTGDFQQEETYILGEILGCFLK